MKNATKPGRVERAYAYHCGVCRVRVFVETGSVYFPRKVGDAAVRASGWVCTGAVGWVCGSCRPARKGKK